jgi:hypothetical protein
LVQELRRRAETIFFGARPHDHDDESQIIPLGGASHTKPGSIVKSRLNTVGAGILSQQVIGVDKSELSIAKGL